MVSHARLTPHIFLMQCIGAVLGAGILHGCTPTSVSATLGANGLGPNNVTGVGLVAVSPGAGYHCTSSLKSDLLRCQVGQFADGIIRDIL